VWGVLDPELVLHYHLMATWSGMGINGFVQGNTNAQLFPLILWILSTIVLSEPTVLRPSGSVSASQELTVKIFCTSFTLSHVYRVICTHFKGSSGRRILKNIHLCVRRTDLSANTAGTAGSVHNQTFRHRGNLTGATLVKGAYGFGAWWKFGKG